MQKKCLNNIEKGEVSSFFFRFFITILLLFLLFDNSKPPKNQLMVKFSVKLIDFYKINISKPAAVKHNVRVCRFSPSCSIYTKQALLKYGFFKGLYLATIRILKCNPFYGTPIMIDKVP